MKITCPHCGKTVKVNGLGRKKLNIPVKNVYDAVDIYPTIKAAADSLGCSRGYIYFVLEKQKEEENDESSGLS
jgi:hypothetical protein